MNMKTYKPEQLPFEEFEEVVRALKRKLDDNAPNYPLVARATDRDGLELMHQHFTGPFKRPVAQVTNHLKDWGPPVLITMKDSSGIQTQGALNGVTVKNAQPEDPDIQLGLSDLDIFQEE